MNDTTIYKLLVTGSVKTLLGAKPQSFNVAYTHV